MAAELTFGPGGDGTEKMNFDLIKKSVDDFRAFSAIASSAIFIR